MTNEDKSLNLSKIDIMIRCLGTMVMEPQYEKSEIVGEKKYAGNIQMPIIKGDNRDVIIDELMKLIKEV